MFNCILHSIYSQQCHCIGWPLALNEICWLCSLQWLISWSKANNVNILIRAGASTVQRFPRNGRTVKGTLEEFVEIGSELIDVWPVGVVWVWNNCGAGRCNLPTICGRMSKSSWQCPTESSNDKQQLICCPRCSHKIFPWHLPLRYHCLTPSDHPRLLPPQAPIGSPLPAWSSFGHRDTRVCSSLISQDYISHAWRGGWGVRILL